MIQRMLAIWSLVPLPFLKPAWTSGNSLFMYCWSLAWRILSILNILTSRMSGSRWVITPSWLSGLWSSFLHSSSVYSCYLFLISSASVRSIPFLSFIKPIFAWTATHSSIHAWKIPWTQEPGGLQSMGLQRVGHDWETSLCVCVAWNVPLVSLIFLKRSLVFPILWFSLIFLHWLLRKSFLSLLAILWNSAFRCLHLSFSPLLFTSLFSAICKASSDSHFAFLHLFFLGMVLIQVKMQVLIGLKSKCQPGYIPFWRV